MRKNHDAANVRYSRAFAAAASPYKVGDILCAGDATLKVTEVREDGIIETTRIELPDGTEQRRTEPPTFEVFHLVPSPEEREHQLDTELVSLWEAGLSRRSIAETMDLPESDVQTRIRAFQRSGRIQKRSPGRPRRK